MARPTVKMVELFRRSVAGRASVAEEARLRRTMNEAALTAAEVDLYEVVSADPVVWPEGKRVAKRDGSED